MRQESSGFFPMNPMNPMNLKIFFILIVSLCLTSSALAEDAINQKNGVALDGYDAVVYFTREEAVKGSEQISYKWKGVLWYFSSEENRKMFKKNPQHYAPQYGGFCAFAMSKGSKADVNPRVFMIYEDRLYLNYNGSAQRYWQQSLSDNIKKADYNWNYLK
jgi:YHS domain-containing protein